MPLYTHIIGNADFFGGRQLGQIRAVSGKTSGPTVEGEFEGVLTDLSAETM